MAPLLVLGLAAAVLAGCGESGQDYANSTLNAIERGKANGARGDMQALSASITTYVTQEGDLPQAHDIHSLADILEPTYQRIVKRADPWGTDYAVTIEGSDYTVRSAGADTTWDTEDDLIVENGQVTQMPAGFATKL
jgi:hypothetical protein